MIHKLLFWRNKGVPLCTEVSSFQGVEIERFQDQYNISMDETRNIIIRNDVISEVDFTQIQLASLF